MSNRKRCVAVETSDNRRDDDRRRASGPGRWRDRRSGFDRRLPEGAGPIAAYRRMLARYRDQPRAILLVLAIFTALNLADLLLTYRALIKGAVEVNPIINWLFDLHPVWAGVAKMSIGMVVAEMIWVWRRYRRALEVSIIATVLMTVIFFYHLILANFVLI